MIRTSLAMNATHNITCKETFVMTWKNRLAIWVAWHLPSCVAKWAFVRVATGPQTLRNYPADQKVGDVLKVWD